MSAASLEGALAELGLRCDIEARDTLALVLGEADVAVALTNAATRRQALRIARDHGFTHLALELVDAGDRATIPRH